MHRCSALAAASGLLLSLSQSVQAAKAIAFRYGPSLRDAEPEEILSADSPAELLVRTNPREPLSHEGREVLLGAMRNLEFLSEKETEDDLPDAVQFTDSGMRTAQYLLILVAANSAATTAPVPQVILPAAPDPEMPAIPGDALLFPPEPMPKLPENRRAGNASAFGLMPVTKPEEEALPPPPDLKTPPRTSLWDLAGLDSALFATQEVAEFLHREWGTGRWSVRPHFSSTAQYDGNVFISDKNAQEDFVITLSPGVSFQVGNNESSLFLAGDYTATGVIFSNHSSENSIDHRAQLELQWQLAKLTLGLRLGYAAASGTSIDISNRVRRQVYQGGVRASYRLDEKFSVEVDADYVRTDYGSLIGSQDTHFQSYLDYQYFPKLSFGIGGSLGFTEVQRAETQTSETAAMRATYVATGKTTISTNFGIEFRQLGNGGGNSVSPVFGLELSLAAREGTNVTVSAQRRVFTSAIFENQNYTSTGISATVTQRLVNRFNVFLSGGYENLSYSSAGRGVNATREDNYFYVRTGIQWQAFSRASFGVFYEYSQNASGGERGQGFQRDRIGTQISLVY